MMYISFIYDDFWTNFYKILTEFDTDWIKIVTSRVYTRFVPNITQFQSISRLHKYKLSERVPWKLNHNGALYNGHTFYKDYDKVS